MEERIATTITRAISSVQQAIGRAAGLGREGYSYFDLIKHFHGDLALALNYVIAEELKVNKLSGDSNQVMIGSYCHLLSEMLNENEKIFESADEWRAYGIAAGFIATMPYSWALSLIVEAGVAAAEFSADYGDHQAAIYRCFTLPGDKRSKCSAEDREKSKAMTLDTADLAIAGALVVTGALYAKVKIFKSFKKAEKSLSSRVRAFSCGLSLTRNPACSAPKAKDYLDRAEEILKSSAYEESTGTILFFNAGNQFRLAAELGVREGGDVSAIVKAAEESFSSFVKAERFDEALDMLRILSKSTDDLSALLLKMGKSGADDVSALLAHWNDTMKASLKAVNITDVSKSKSAGRWGYTCKMAKSILLLVEFANLKSWNLDNLAQIKTSASAASKTLKCLD